MSVYLNYQHISVHFSPVPSASVAKAEPIGPPSSKATTNNIKQGGTVKKQAEEIKWNTKETLY